MNIDLFNLLISTTAFEFAPVGQPFWYTSGTVGPLYLNTHYLFGSRVEAESLLAFINENKHNREQFLPALLAKVERQYAENSTYRTIIDRLVELIDSEIGASNFQFVSGGERRDWFFSLSVAQRLQKPSVIIFKDRSTYLFESDRSGQSKLSKVEKLNNAAIVHVADLVTEASSYIRSWIPAITDRGGKLQWAVNVVDRGQGAVEKLQFHGVSSYSLIQIDQVFFETLLKQGYIEPEEAETLKAYHQNPHESMKALLEKYPDILRHALDSSDSKIKARANLMLEQNSYQFDSEFLRSVVKSL